MDRDPFCTFVGTRGRQQGPAFGHHRVVRSTLIEQRMQTRQGRVRIEQ